MATSITIPRRVLIIGGGPSGLVTLRNLVERGRFEHVELWERRDDVGGVWYLDEPLPTSPGPDSDTLGRRSVKPRWPSPSYKGLIGNILPEFMSFSGFPFPEPPTTTTTAHQPFPTLVETHAYLRAFAEPYLKDGRIKLNREVVSVFECQPEGSGKFGAWKVIFRDWNSDDDERREVEEFWDAVVVATGLWDCPVWPDTEGLEELKMLGLAKHAKWYRGPEGFEGKKLLVIGNANSSNEMAAQLCKISDGPVYQSIRRPAFSVYPSLASERIKMVSPVSEYNPKGRDKFDAVLTDGTTLTNLDYVHCGTGYRPLPDYIHVLNKSDSNLGKHKPFTSKEVVPWRVPYLHRMVMYAYNPSLAFASTGRFYTPFMVADLVSIWLALAWRGEVSYPDTPEGRLVFEQERLALLAKRREQKDDPSSLLAYSVMTLDEQEYASGFRRDVVNVRPELEDVLPVWNDEKMEERRVMLTKTKYLALEYARDHSS